MSVPGSRHADEAVLDLLATGRVDVLGRLPWSSNHSFLVRVVAPGEPEPEPEDGGSGGHLAVYKPVAGERPLHDFPPGLHRREVAAYALSRALGWDLVPPTLARDDLPFDTGSLQHFEPVDHDEHYFAMLEEGLDGETRLACQRICAFDVVANNTDRKAGHVLRRDDGAVVAIDHGLCFHPAPKLRSVVWEFAGEPVPAGVLEDLDRARPHLADALGEWLTARELRSTLERLDALVGSGEFPEPSEDRYCYPWPLV